MSAALTNKSLMNGIKKASPIGQTSCLEDFHSVLNQFSPKMIGYSFSGMFCRYCMHQHFFILYTAWPQQGVAVAGGPPPPIIRSGNFLPV